MPQLRYSKILDLPIPILRSDREVSGPFPTLEDRWTLVEAFVREFGLVKHQIESFNDFVDKKLP